MIPSISKVIPVLTYDGTPPDSFGYDGAACIDNTSNPPVLYPEKVAGAWGTGTPLTGIDPGTAEGRAGSPEKG